MRVCNYVKSFEKKWWTVLIRAETRWYGTIRLQAGDVKFSSSFLYCCFVPADWVIGVVIHTMVEHNSQNCQCFQ